MLNPGDRRCSYDDGSACAETDGDFGSGAIPVLGGALGVQL